VLFVAVDGQSAGAIAVADPIRSTTPDAIAALKADGLRLVMVTGDHTAAANAVAQALGIDEVYAEVLPEQKRDIVADLQRKGRLVAMAGDGINDAPALAQATVGIAMGTGTDVAIESAAVTLVKGDSRARPSATSVRTCFWPSCTTRSVCRSRPALSTRGRESSSPRSGRPLR